MKNSIELDSKDELEAIKTLKVIKSKYFFLGNRLNNSLNFSKNKLELWWIRCLHYWILY